MMRQKSNMAAKAFALMAALCLSWSSIAQTTTDTAKEKLTVRADAPARYTVQKGDTLWGIAGKYLDKPWRWPEIWNMNKDQIKNPNRIYPGDVLILSRDTVSGEPRLTIEKISPTVRVSPIPSVAIPSIPPGDIEPFLTRSFIAGKDGLVNAAEVVEGRDRSRILRGTNDTLYAIGVTPDKGTRWNLFRPGKPIRDIEGNLLGVEYRYLGTAEVDRFGSDANEASAIRILSANEEIGVGDRLVPVPSEVVVNYTPHAPDRKVEAYIVSSFRDATEMGRSEVVVIDRGEKQGIEVGTVLAVYRQFASIADPRPNTSYEQIVRGFDNTTWYKKPNMVKIPDERVALIFVFRTFDNASYAMTLNTTDPVLVGDFVRNP